MRRLSRRCTTVVGICMALGLPASYAATSSQPAPRLLRLADYYEQVRIGRVLVSAASDAVVFERWSIDRPADAWVSSLQRVDVDGGPPRLLVANAAAPQRSPDDRWLAFLRDGQVWVLPLRGGDPWPATATPEPVSSFDWAPDSRSLVISTRDPRGIAPEILPADPGSASTGVEQAPASELPDPGDWVAADPAGGGAASGDTASGSAGAGESVSTPSDVVPEPLAPEVWLRPGAGPPMPGRLLPRVITELPFKADGEGYLGPRHHHLYVVELDIVGRRAQGARRISSGPWDDDSPAWSPDGSWIAFVSDRTIQDAAGNDDIWVVSPAGGDAIRLTAAAAAESDPVWAPDSEHLAFLSVPASPPVYAQTGLWLLSLAPVTADSPAPLMLAGDPVELTASLDRTLVGVPHWRADGAALLVTAEDRGSVALIQVTTGLAPRRRGNRRRRRAPALPRGVLRLLVGGPRVVSDFALSPDDRRVVAVIGWGTQPAELFVVPAGGQPAAFPMTDAAAHVQPTAVPPDASLRRLTDENRSWLGHVTLSTPEPLRYTGSDGTPLEGWLLRPTTGEARSSLPLIVDLHGGPVAQHTWALNWQSQWFAARGYAVLLLNPRGSSGYGLEFAHALFADWGGVDGDDVLAGVQHLLDRGVADARRVGVGGWSYGGILTNLLISSSDRFAAAVAGAAESDYLSAYGTDDLHRWWEQELGLPYDPQARARYRSMSPISRVERINTPTLFLAGELDWRVPASQSEQLYAQLRRRMLDGGPATGLILYPGQSHDGYPPSLSIDVLRRYIAWYDRYLKGDSEADPFFGRDAW